MAKETPTPAPVADETPIIQYGAESDISNETAPVAQPAPITPAPAPVAPPQVIVQMVTPQAGEPTEGLSETKPGGEYFLQRPDGTGKYEKYKVDALGNEI